MKNAKFYKRNLSMACWYGCRRKSKGVLLFLNGNEIPVCIECSLKYIKTVRKHSGNVNIAIGQESLKFSDSHTAKFEQMGILGAGHD